MFRMKPRHPLCLLAILLVATGLCFGQVDHEQKSSVLQGDSSDVFGMVKRAETYSDINKDIAVIDDQVNSMFHLDNSFHHLMIHHWAGNGSSIVCWLARGQVSLEISSSSPIINYQTF